MSMTVDIIIQHFSVAPNAGRLISTISYPECSLVIDHILFVLEGTQRHTETNKSEKHFGIQFSINRLCFHLMEKLNN